MRILVPVLILIASATTASAQYSNRGYGSSYGRSGDVYVQPHVRSNGDYVDGHYRTRPNNNPYDNYSTRGNVNPYTGQRGTRNPW